MKRNRLGLSLMEVILALAIFGVSVAAIGELLRLGTRAASRTRDLTTAQLLCESKMAELAAGILPLQSTSLATIEENPDWIYSVEMLQVEQEGLVSVFVTVQQTEDTIQPVSYSLVSWMVDPGLDVANEELDEPLEATSGESSEL